MSQDRCAQKRDGLRVSEDILCSPSSTDFLNAILVESAVVIEAAGMWDLERSEDCMRVFFTLSGVKPVILDWLRILSCYLMNSLLLVLVSIGFVGDLLLILSAYSLRTSATLFLMSILCSRTLISSSIS